MRFFAVLILAMLASAPALAQELLVGGRAGGSWVQRSQPNDPEGEPTVLFGTAFTGYGIAVGGTLQRELTKVGQNPLLLDADLLISYRRALGFAESRTTNARRELILMTTAVQLPILIGFGIRGTSTLLQFSAGPELLAGITSGSATRQTGVEGVPDSLETRPAIHLGVTGKLGMMFDAAGGKLPIDLRLTYDPFVARSTRDRFDNYVSAENPGRYGVAFNWQALVTVGWVVPLGSRADDDDVWGDDAPMGAPEPAE